MDYETVEDAARDAMRTGRNIICFVDGTLIKVYMLGSWRPASASDRAVFDRMDAHNES